MQSHGARIILGRIDAACAEVMAGLTGKANTLAQTIRSSAGPQMLFALAFALVEDHCSLRQLLAP